MKCLALFLAALIPCLSQAQEAQLGSDAYIMSLFPFPEAAEKINHKQQGSPLGAPRVSVAQLKCQDKTMIPATPGQETKSYHVDVLFRYNANKVPGDRKGSPANWKGSGVLTINENVCAMPGVNMSSRRPDGSMWCMQAKFGRYTMMSDLFYCKNSGDITYYRAYWETAIILRSWSDTNAMITDDNEHLATMSQGRGDANPRSSLGSFRDFVPGGTGLVEASRFLFFSEATEAEKMAIIKVNNSVAGDKGTYVKCPDGRYAVRAEGGCKK